MFWDMQAGSDGVQSCASCHFSAGADIRTRNQISPGLHATNFHGVSPDVPGDSSFSNSNIPFTANDGNTRTQHGSVELGDQAGLNQAALGGLLAGQYQAPTFDFQVAALTSRADINPGWASYDCCAGL